MAAGGEPAAGVLGIFMEWTGDLCGKISHPRKRDGVVDLFAGLDGLVVLPYCPSGRGCSLPARIRGRGFSYPDRRPLVLLLAAKPVGHSGWSRFTSNRVRAIAPTVFEKKTIGKLGPCRCAAYLVSFFFSGRLWQRVL